MGDFDQRRGIRLGNHHGRQRYLARTPPFRRTRASVGVNELDSPTITLPAGSAQLTFRQNYNLESGYDGGVLEIKIGSGAWTDIVTAGGSFASGGYIGVA